MNNLFLSLYPEKNPERQKELLTCLKNNAKVFDNIFILTELDDQIKFIPEIKSKANIFRLPITVRPTFKSFFDCVNHVCDNSDINYVCNADIYFEEITKTPKQNECWALCRYEVDKNGNKTFMNRKDSADSFVFAGKIKVPRYSAFFIGIPGCDNRISFELKEIGYQISNPSLTVKCYHLHTGAKSYDTATAIRVSRPYHFLPPTELI
jgi:hypothetical protein